jgi:hypothetical protein
LARDKLDKRKRPPKFLSGLPAALAAHTVPELHDLVNGLYNHLSKLFRNVPILSSLEMSPF